MGFVSNTLDTMHTNRSLSLFVVSLCVVLRRAVGADDGDDIESYIGFTLYMTVLRNQKTNAKVENREKEREASFHFVQKEV